MVAVPTTARALPSTNTRAHYVSEVSSSAHPDPSSAGKRSALLSWLAARGSALVAYSGGVDSAYLASAALDVLGRQRMLAVVGRSASYPAAQWEAARQVAENLSLPLLEVDTAELADPEYAANPSNRCYFCKRELWSLLLPIARQHGLAVVVDGTNADDLRQHRPGARAGAERGVSSPLAEVGLTKGEIRQLSLERGLPTWDQPSSPCLSSRLPYGTPVTASRLAQIERAEGALRARGFAGDLRVRHHGDVASVELAAAELTRAFHPSQARAIREAVRGAGFARVVVDLRGFRSGSLNVLSGVTGR
ncbi:MAG: ATP-dependent sacrificial sulfur transferase LarE [Gemmatimonadaceae bacterium]